MNLIPYIPFPGIPDLKMFVVNVANVAGVNTEAGLSNEKVVDDACTFSQNDPYGFMMALLGMGIVFSALLLLYVIFTNTPRLYTTAFKDKVQALFTRKRQAVVPVSVALQSDDPKQTALTGEVNAAIAAAIHLYRSELHDHENTVLTIKKVARTYSPWSSKIYGLRNLHL